MKYHLESHCVGREGTGKLTPLPPTQQFFSGKSVSALTEPLLSSQRPMPSLNNVFFQELSSLDLTLPEESLPLPRGNLSLSLPYFLLSLLPFLLSFLYFSKKFFIPRVQLLKCIIWYLGYFFKYVNIVKHNCVTYSK